MTSPSLDQINLGSSDLRVSALGIGTNAWNNNAELTSVFQTAQNLGINLFDTAEVYQLGGSERRLGQIMRATGQRPILATKFMPYPWRWSPSNLLDALRNSLKRLQTNQVDLYQIHFAFPPVAIETWVNALADAAQAGLTRAVGVSNYNPAQMKRAHAALAKRGVALVSNQVEYSLLKRDVERNGLLDLCRELNVTLIAYKPLAKGLVSGRYTPDHPPQGLIGVMYNREYVRKIQPLVDQLRQIGEKHGKTCTQVALNWLICKGTLPIPGATSVRHLEENAGAMGWRLSQDQVATLDQLSAQIH